MTVQLLRQALAGLRVLLALSVLTGALYPLAVWAVAQLAFSHQANGSRVAAHGRTVGSALLGQAFSGRGWFHPRPSAAGPHGYDALASGASNLGPSNPLLLSRVHGRRAAALAEDGPGRVPPDALTASASGLDPDISPAYARRQTARVARARHLPPQRVAALVSDHVKGRTLGFLGEPRVDVLELNIALDGLTRAGRPGAGPAWAEGGG